MNDFSLETLDQAIMLASDRIQNPQPGDDLSDVAELADGLAALVRLKREATPRTPQAIADELVAMGVKPAEFGRILRQAWEESAP